MAIKRWNANTSTWELVGTPGTASPSAIGAAGLVGGNTFSGNQIVASNSYISVGDRSNIAISGATPLNGININNSSSRPRIGFFDSIGGDTTGSSLGTIEFFDYLKTGQGEKRSAVIEVIREGSSATQRGGAIIFNTVPNASNSITERMRIDASGNVGIATGTPQARLHVNGSIRLDTEADGQVIKIHGRSADNFSQIAVRKNNSNTFTHLLQFGGDTAFAFVQNTLYASDGTNLVERFRINGSGDVQISNSPVDTLRYFDIYNTSSGNNAGSIIRLITNNIANTGTTSVDIVKYRSGAFVINNNDGFTTFNTGGAERMRILSTGAVVIGHTAALNNEAFGVRSNVNIQTIWLDSTDASYSTVALGNRITRANTSAYTFLQNWSGAGSDTEHYLRGDGQAYADGSWNGGGADYAEYFEWADGNPNNEDRRGYSVSLINDKVKIAEEGEVVFGVVSGNPSVVGDDAPMKWTGKYLKDDFGSYIRDEDGYRVLNPEYDEELEYTSRENRPEWSTVGLMGKIRLRKGQIVAAGWIKMRDISETIEEWLIK